MDNLAFFRRLGGAEVEARLANAAAARQVTVTPYIYFTSAVVMNVFTGFVPGKDGFVVIEAGPIIKTGNAVFNTNVQWDDGGTPRNGWIYTWLIDGETDDPLILFLPDYSDGQFYQGCPTTLPYTQGQPPSGLDQPVGFYRYAIGETAGPTPAGRMGSRDAGVPVKRRRDGLQAASWMSRLASLFIEKAGRLVGRG